MLEHGVDEAFVRGKVSRRSPPIQISPEEGCSNPAISRSRVVLPEPLSPSRVRNSPAAICKRKALQYFITHQSAWRRRALQARSDRQQRPAARWRQAKSLRVLDLVPNFGVLRAARHVLPEINALHVFVGIVQVQSFLFFRWSGIAAVAGLAGV